jgi:hypothetical protein
MRYIFPDKIEKTLFFMIRNFVIMNSVHKEFSALGTLLLRNFVIRNFVVGTLLLGTLYLYLPRVKGTQDRDFFLASVLKFVLFLY